MSRLDRPLGRLLNEGDFGDWQALLHTWRASAAGAHLIVEVERRVAAGAVVYPAQVFRALALTPLAQTRVLILGQDPYHGPGQAEGLAFSVPAGERIPPSLRNIFKELQRDLGMAMPDSGSLLPWSQRGVLLLNASLTVEDGRPGAHAKLGWQALTDSICQSLWADAAPKVFMFWGAHAQSKRLLMPAEQGRQHLLLSCNHPSPLAALRPPAPFIGSGHFRRASEFLVAAGRGGSPWALAPSMAVL